MLVKIGTSRIVFLINKYAIKIANFRNGQQLFIYGCYGNISERKYYKQHSKVDYNDNMVEYIAPSLFCSWFGLIQIQIRAEPLTRKMSNKEFNFFRNLTTDNKEENFGIINNKIVCIDYV